MFDQQWLVNVAEKGYVLRQAKHVWENEFQKKSKKLRDRIYDILEWKDENLNQNFLGCRMLYMFQIKRITRTKVVVKIWKYGADFANYYNVSFDEICSDDWKEKALDEYNKKRQDAKRKEEELKAKQEAEKEEKERAEYERLKAKFETKADNNNVYDE